MSTSQKKGGRYVIGCDTKKCGQHISSVLGAKRAIAMARDLGWWVQEKQKQRKSRAALCPAHNNTEDVRR